MGIRLTCTTNNCSPDVDVMKAGIDDLLDCTDAMKDLIVAESIHQLVQGNTERAGALLKSIHELKPPTKFESINTPRTPAQILTHRAAAFFKPGDYNNPVNPWKGVEMSQRASTEPGLNEWLGEIIGAPDTCQCTVTEAESRTSAIVTLKDLNLQPIDILYLVPAQLDKEESELSKRIAYNYRLTQIISEKAGIEIDYNKAAKNSISMAEVLPLLRLLKEIVTNSKALDAADFDLQQYQGKANSRNLTIKKSGVAVIDIGSLYERKENLIAALEDLMKKLKQANNKRSATMCANIRECLVECCNFEIRDAFPKNSVGENKELRAELHVQSEEVIIAMEKMLASVQKYKNLDVEELIQSFSIFFGPGFKVLPVFHFPKNDDDEVDRMSLVGNAYIAEKDLFSFITGKTSISPAKHLQNWLNEIMYLRPKIASFETVRLLYDSLQQKQLEIHIMQLPYETIMTAGSPRISPREFAG